MSTCSTEYCQQAMACTRDKKGDKFRTKHVMMHGQKQKNKGIEFVWDTLQASRLDLLMENSFAAWNDEGGDVEIQYEEPVYGQWPV